MYYYVDCSVCVNNKKLTLNIEIMRLSIGMFKKELVSCGRWKIGYTSGKRGLLYISHTTDSKLIDRTFGSDRPTVRALAELCKACKR